MGVDIDILIEDTVCTVLATILKEADSVKAVQGKKKRWDAALAGNEYRMY
jgi:hypothetical protein